MSKIKTLISKELKAQLDNLGGYILIGLFLTIAYYLFLKTFFVNGEVSVQSLFSDLSWLLCVFVAAITMGAFASEKERQTLEYLLTKPLTIAQLLWGKILGSFIYTLIPIALTLPLPLLVSRFGSLDWGEVLAGYLAITLLSFSLVCLGVAFSALVRKPVIAFLITAAVLLFLNIISSSFFAVNIDPVVASFLARFGIFNHYFDLARGVLDLGDIAYFLLVSFIGLTIGYLSIYSWRVNKFKFPAWQIINFALVISLLSYLAFFDHYFFRPRFDLTSRRRYTISDVTKNILKEPGKVKIDLYISDNLPSQFQSTVQEIKNTLNDYARLAGSNLELRFISPKGKEKELADMGITATPFSIVSQDNFQQQTGYVAALVQNEDGSQKVPINFSQIANIDYELTRTISKMKTQAETPKIGYTTAAGEFDLAQISPGLMSLLDSEMSFEAVELPVIESSDSDVQSSTTSKKKDEIEKTVPDLKQYQALVVVQPSQNYTSESLEALTDYYDQGGKILYLVAGNQIEPQMLVAMTTAMGSGLAGEKAEQDPLQIFSEYGLTINHNLIGDYQAYSLINSGQGGIGVMPYEYWPRAQLNTKNNTDFAQLPNEVMMFWPSSLTFAPNSGWTALYQTTNMAVATQSAEMIDIAPVTTPRTTLPGRPDQYILGATQTNSQGGRLIVFGSPQIFSDQLLGNGPHTQNNYVLGMMTLESLTTAQNLSEIQSRQIGNPRFILDEKTLISQLLLKFGAPLISLILLTALGYSRILRRRKLSAQIETLSSIK